MPYVKRRTTRTRRTVRKSIRRPTKHRARVNELVYTLNTNKIGIPPRFPCKLRYAQSNTVNTSLGLAGYQVFSLNSLFDPDVSGGGQQPMFFDQLAALYYNYNVTKCDVEFTVIPTSNVPLGVVVVPSNANTVTGYTFEDNKESKGSIVKYIAGNTNKVTIKKTFNIATLIGKSLTTILNDDLYVAPVTGNPGDMLYVTIGVVALDGSTASAYVETKINYHSIFSQLRQVISS